jgi:hypothetical protein
MVVLVPAGTTTSNHETKIITVSAKSGGTTGYVAT